MVRGPLLGEVIDMPRRNDINKVVILGSGPIRIGQAAEFDFSGSQACRALRADGYEVVLINSNPATIQNDPEMADRIYIEPLLPEVVKRIMEVEKPDALLGCIQSTRLPTHQVSRCVLERLQCLERSGHPYLLAAHLA